MNICTDQALRRGDPLASENLTFNVLTSNRGWVQLFGRALYYETFTVIETFGDADSISSIVQTRRDFVRIHDRKCLIDLFCFTSNWSSCSFFIGEGYEDFYPPSDPEEFLRHSACLPQTADDNMLTRAGADGDRQMHLGECERLRSEQ